MSTRTQGILDRVSDALKFSGVRWILGDGVLTNYMQSFVDDTMKRNAEFQSKAGVSPKIVRKSPTKCCPWCDALVGTYNYPDDVPDDVYRRHDNCNCIVEFYPGDGHKQNVWTKEWDNEDPEQLGKRKTAGKGNKRTAQERKDRLLQNQYRDLQDAKYGIHTIDGERLLRLTGTGKSKIQQAIQNALANDADGLLIYTDKVLTADELADLQLSIAEELGDVSNFTVKIWGNGISGVETLLEV